MLVDCSNLGGYDPKDKCRQTCLKSAEEIYLCVDKCRSKSLAEETESEQQKYFLKCEIDCKGLD